MMYARQLILGIIFIILLGYSAARDVNVFRMSQKIEDKLIKHEYPKTRDGVKFAFAKQFQDHMVLQQAPRRANIYGFSPDIGQKVILMLTTVVTKYYYATTVKEGPVPGVGKWMFTLDPIKTFSPVTILVASDAGTLSLTDVLFGDVWLCSGQSNMAFVISMMFNGTEEIANAHKYPNLRVMTVALSQSSTPQYDLRAIEKQWSAPSKDSVGGPMWTYFSAVCWVYGKAIHESLGYPIGLIATDWGGTPVEAWSSPDALAKCNMEDKNIPLVFNQDSKIKSGIKRQFPETKAQNHDILRGPQTDSVLWNAMIHPFLGMTIYGAIWYQGEDDAFPSRVHHYNCTFPAMIEDWRVKFNQASKGQTSGDFPFGFVQLAPTLPQNVSSGFPEIRWHQTADVGYVPNPKMTNVFMAVAMDLPDLNGTYGPIHPRDKLDVGNRLALSGLAVAYNHPELYQGPFPVIGKVTPDHELELDYGNRWKLVVKNKTGFEVFCSSTINSNPTWIPTLITSFTTTTVNISIGVCETDVQALRYAWKIKPCSFKGCAIYSTINSLPAPPFVAYAQKDNNGNSFFDIK